MTFARYLSRQILRRILGAGAVLLMLALTLDLMANGTDLVEAGGSRAVLEYAALRTPLLAVTLMPPAVLIGTALGFLLLAARSELTAVRASGSGTLRLLVMLIPVAIALGGAYSLLGDRLLSAAETRIALRFPEAAEAGRETEDLWIRAPGAVAHVARASADARELQGVTLHLVDPSGRISGRIRAARASYADGAWKLEEVRIRPLGGALSTRDTYFWTSALDPSDILRSGSEVAASSDEASAVLAGELPAVRSEAYYRTRRMRVYAAWFVPAVMVMLAARASFAHGRVSDGARKAGTAVALGFLYIAVDGFAASMSEAGAVAAPVAAFAPLAAFAVLGLWSILTHEG